MAPCTPWITGADLPPNCVAGLPVGITADELATAAWQILFPLSGRRFCSVLTTVLPEVIAGDCTCAPGPRAVLDALAGCGCSAYEVVLAGPATSISQVVIDRVVVASDTYELRDGRRVVRVDGKTWPCCANRAGQARSFTVTYTRGEAPTEIAILAAVEMACELAKAVKDDADCQLPRAVQSMTRQNLTISFNPTDVFDDGLTGLPVCDLFIASANPSRKQRAGATIAYPGMAGLSTGAEPTPVLDPYGGY